MEVELSKTYHVDVAHRTPHGGADCLHGHTLEIEVVVAGHVTSPLGWLIDFGDIKAACQPLLDQLDHHCLNEVEGMEDASVRSAAEWLRDRLAPGLPCLKDVRATIVGDGEFLPVLLEAGHGLPARWRFTFEAAQSLPQLEPGHPCQRLHGHTYSIEAGAEDAERLKDNLRGVYDALDHTCLNDVPGLNEATSERLCEWIWNRLAEKADGLRVVVVQETGSSRCIYHGR